MFENIGYDEIIFFSILWSKNELKISNMHKNWLLAHFWTILFHFVKVGVEDEYIKALVVDNDSYFDPIVQ